MLSITTIAAGSHETAQYYTESHQQLERYYEKESQGIWVGGEGFGLDGKVVGPEFQNLLDGRHLSGESLITAQGEKRRVGYDLTFSCDKSVSILWARADGETRTKIEAVFHDSVKQSLKYIERDIMTECVRRGKAGQFKEAPKELVFATFQHGSSRAQDPQLHTHCVLLNVAERKDGSFGAIDPKQVFKAQVLARKMFGAEFSTRLSRELGVGIMQTRDGFRVKGVPESLIKHYSKRKEEIEKEAAVLGIESAHGRERIALNTRAKKQDVNTHDLLNSWQTEMDAHKFSLEYAQKHCFGMKQQRAPDMGEAIKKTIADLSQHHSTFTEIRLKQKLAENSQGIATIEELKGHFKKVIQDKEIVKLGLDRQGNMRFTTTAILEKEKNLLSQAQALGQKMGHRVEGGSVNKILSSEKFSQMSEEQRAAAQHVFKSGDLALVQGVAGSGKSFTMRAVREVYEQEGFNVIGLAPTGKAAEELRVGAGISSQTVDKYLFDRNKGATQFSSRDVVVVDESGMLGSNKMAELINDAHAQGAKVILVGDSKQLQPIDFGNPFAKLKDVVGGAEINTVRRQREEWQREAAWDIRQGKSVDALAKYEKNGLFKLENSMAELKSSVVADYLRDRHHGGSQLILGSTNAVVKEINTEIRESLKKSGESLNARHQYVLEVRNREGTATRREFCVGDRVYFTQNNRKIGVQNGSLGTIEQLKRVERRVYEFQVKLDNGTAVKFSTDKYDRIDHGYAVTIHKSQGTTVDRTYVAVSSTMDRESAYVAMTRHRESAHVYAAKRDFEKMKLEGHARGPRQVEVKQVEAQKQEVTVAIGRVLDRSQIKEMSIDYEKAQAPRQEVKQKFAELMPLEEHKLLSQKLINAKSRDEISQVLKEIVVTPAGVDNEYRAYPTQRADWQEKALDALKNGHFEKTNLQEIAQTISQKPLGTKSVLTVDEIKNLEEINKSVGQTLERSIRMSREFEKEFVTKPQVEMARKLKGPDLPVEDRAQIVKNLYSQPSGLGIEFGTSHAHGSEVQNKARAMMDAKDLSKAKCQELADIVLSKPVGQEMRPSLLTSIELDRSSKIKTEFNETLRQWQEKSKLEHAQEFKTPAHEMFAERLKQCEKREYSEKAGHVFGIATSPRGVGPEFGIANYAQTDFQKFAAKMLEKKDLSQGSIDKLCGMVMEKKMGLASSDKQLTIGSEKLKQKLEPEMRQTVERTQKLEMERTIKMSKGRGMSR